MCVYNHECCWPVYHVTGHSDGMLTEDDNCFWFLCCKHFSNWACVGWHISDVCRTLIHKLELQFAICWVCMTTNLQYISQDYLLSFTRIDNLCWYFECFVVHKYSLKSINRMTLEIALCCGVVILILVNCVNTSIAEDTLFIWLLGSFPYSFLVMGLFGCIWSKLSNFTANRERGITGCKIEITTIHRKRSLCTSDIWGSIKHHSASLASPVHIAATLWA